MQPQNQAPADFEAGVTAALQLVRAGRVTGWTYEGGSTVYYQLTARVGYQNEQFRTHVSISREDVRRTIRNRWADGYGAEAILLDMFAHVPFHITIEVLGPANLDNPRWYSDESWGINAANDQSDRRVPRRALAREVGEATRAAATPRTEAGLGVGARALRLDWQTARNEMEGMFGALRVNPA